jgi:hypothetical protein
MALKVHCTFNALPSSEVKSLEMRGNFRQPCPESFLGFGSFALVLSIADASWQRNKI